MVSRKSRSQTRLQPRFLHNFDTPANAMRLIRSQKWDPKMLESKLRVSENRSLIERRKCKAANNIKKGMIEHQGLEAKDIAVN